MIAPTLRKAVTQKVTQAFCHLTTQAETQYPFLALPFKRIDKRWHTLAEHYRSSFETLLVLGTGGSSLGARALCALQQSWVPSDMALPKIYFLDNLDAVVFWELISTLNPEKTGILAISKSGHTPEVLLSLMRWIEHAKESKLRKPLSHHIHVITEDKASPLTTLAQKFSLPLWEHPKNIGGRFSCFSLVGLIPALILDINVKDYLQGAATTCEQFFLKKFSAPLESVTLKYALLHQYGIRNHVMMMYSETLHTYALWYRQLWAESLGKQGKGFFPTVDQCPQDQHSILQLYLDGPPDKMFHLFFPLAPLNEKKHPHLWRNVEDTIFTLSKLSIQDLVRSHGYNTLYALHQRKRPVCASLYHEVTPFLLGQLMMHAMLETLLMSHMLALDPLTQPGVESIKSSLQKFYGKN